MKKKKNNKFEIIINRVNIISIILIGIYAIISGLLIIQTTSYSFKISKLSIEEIKQEESLVNYISTINSYSYTETTEIISNIENKMDFMIVELIIPTIIGLLAYIFIIVTLKEINELTKNINNNKKTYTQENYELLKRIIKKAAIGIFFLTRDLILWIFVCLLMTIILHLFESCLELTKEN